MMNSELVSKLLQIVFGLENNSSQKLLIMDSFTGHRTEQVKDTCRLLGITRAMIPGGLTGELQPLDRTVNRSFKSHLKEYWKHELMGIEYHDSTTNISNWNINKMIKGINQSWSLVTQYNC